MVEGIYIYIYLSILCVIVSYVGSSSALKVSLTEATVTPSRASSLSYSSQHTDRQKRLRHLIALGVI